MEVLPMKRFSILNGPDTGRSFELKEGVNYLGRSHENDVQIKDQTVSRQHLRILKKGSSYFLTDLGSLNGTFFGGRYLNAGIEVEVKEGVPIAIGMTLLCIGEQSLGEVMPFLNSTGLNREIGEGSGIFAIHKGKTNQKKLESLYKIFEVLALGLPIKDKLGKVLDIIIELLVRIDRAAVILIDPVTTKTTQFIYRSKAEEVHARSVFSLDAVYRVIREKRAVAISDTRTEETEIELAATLKMKEITSVMCVPLMSHSDVLGVIYLDSLKRTYGFLQEDVALFQHIAQRAVLAIERDKFTSELENVADKLLNEHLC
jgi:two-component system, NtrC family, sensor kinase